MGGGTTGITDAHGSTHTASTSTTTGASFMLAISNTMAHHVRDCGEELHLSCVYGGLSEIGNFFFWNWSPDFARLYPGNENVSWSSQ